MTGEWMTAAELASAALPGLPTTKRGIALLAERDKWAEVTAHEGTRWRKRGAAIEYHARVLPLAAQAALAMRMTVDVACERGRAKTEAHLEAWQWFDGLSEAKRNEAARRLRILNAVEALHSRFHTIAAAIDAVAAVEGFRKSAFYVWQDRVRGLLPAEKLPALASWTMGGGKKADIPDEAWGILKADYLRLERPSFKSCMRRLQRVAKDKGWTLPSARTLERRMMALPDATLVLLRQGEDALKRMYPAQERARGHFHALEAVNADGHKFDVFVKWPDGTVGRPLMLAFQDLYSGKILSWRVDISENKEATRLAFGDMVEQFGIPSLCWFDNGRQFASKWITGGSATRNRFKIKDEDPIGLLTLLQVEVHWTTPYSGQSKPIERAFRDFCDDIAKHPEFAGAWTGNTPLAKPENYGSKAVPLDVFLRVVGEGIAEHNARTGRRSAVCRGRSFDEAFAESYAASLIRKASPHERRLWLLAAESVRCDPKDGSITLLGNRYWCDELVGLRGQRTTVRFDPQALHGELHVYRPGDGGYLVAAPCVAAVGFDDIEAARAHNHARRAWMKGVKLQAAAEVKLSIGDVAAMLPKPDQAMPPQARVVRMVRGANALAIAPDAVIEQSPEEIAMLRGLAHQERLRIVGKEGGNG